VPYADSRMSPYVVSRGSSAVARQWVDAGFTHIALVQVGADHQDQFMTWAAQELLPALREI
jgi:hypothetical protein